MYTLCGYVPAYGYKGVYLHMLMYVYLNERMHIVCVYRY